MPGRLGPPPGRYVVRRYAGDDAQSVVVIGEGEAPRRVGRREPRDSVPVTRITVIDADPLADDTAAEQWLATASVGAEFTSVLERLVTAHRLATADPLFADLDLGRAWRTRIGYGAGDQVAEGTWMDARELEPSRPRPSRAARRAVKRGRERPTDRLAALLAGRDAVLASEELTLRARLDLDRMRVREAAIQLEAALTTARAELRGWRTLGDLSDRLVELERHAGPVAEVASAAREGTLDAAAPDVIEAALLKLEAVLRARAIHSAQSG